MSVSTARTVQIRTPAVNPKKASPPLPHAPMQLYDLHVSGMAGRGILEYLHVSKSGGSSMCFAGAGNGCRTFDASLQHTCLLFEMQDR